MWSALDYVLTAAGSFLFLVLLLLYYFWAVQDTTAGFLQFLSETRFARWVAVRLGFPEKVATGKAGMVGKSGEVTSLFSVDNSRTYAIGKVRVGGEIWQARIPISDLTKYEIGTYVEVTAVDGLVLSVERKN